jgi:stage III sporulation protein AB
MLFKLIGACITVSACTFVGFVISGNYSNRLRQLETLHDALNLLETEVSFALSTLPHAMMRVAGQIDGICSRLFKNMAERLQNGNPCSAGETWSNVIREIYPFSSFSESDLEVMLGFGKTLGSSDKDNQIRHIRLTKEKLTALKRQAEEELQKNGRLFKYFVISSGLVIAAILF